MTKRKIIKSIFLSLIAILGLSLLALTHNASAIECSGVDTTLIECDSGGTGGIWYIVNLVINIFTAGIAILGTIGIIWSGVLITSARDNEAQVAKGKKRILEVVIGLVAWGLLYVLIQLIIPGGATIPDSGVEGVTASVDDEAYVGESVPLKVTIIPDTVTDKSYSVSSSDKSIATVAGNNVRCQKVGSTTVKVTTSNGKTAEAPVNCKEKPKEDPTNPGGNTKPGDEPSTEPIDSANGKYNYNGMDYWLNVPESATKNMPVVVFLHGSGETGNASAVSYLPQVRAMMGRSDFISIAPVAGTRNWEEGSKTATIKGIIDDVVKRTGANKNRIYIWGFSMGGRGTFHMVNNYTTYFRAYMVISNCPAAGDTAANYSKIPLKMILGGAGDEIPNYYDCMMSAKSQIESLGGSVEYQQLNGVSHGTMSSSLDYNAVFSWILSH